MKRLILPISILLASAALFVACDSETDGGDDHKMILSYTGSGVIGKGIVDKSTRGGEVRADTVAFSDKHIEWFNTVTREIRFNSDIEPGKNLTPYDRIVFELNGRVLFTAATVVSDVNSQIYHDLVLYIQHNGGYRYFLDDAYPVWAAGNETARANAAAREKGWNTFIEYLRGSNRLREYDDSGNNDDPVIIPPNPYIPSPSTNTGNIELSRFAPKDTWVWNKTEPNTLKIIRSENELKAQITDSSYTESGVDFTKNSMLLVRVGTSYGIHHIYYGLDYGREGCNYSVKVLTNCACVIGDEILAVLCPAIPANKQLSFRVNISGTY